MLGGVIILNTINRVIRGTVKRIGLLVAFLISNVYKDMLSCVIVLCGGSFTMSTNTSKTVFNLIKTLI